MKQRQKLLTFFCPFCGRKTKLDESLNPLGKKKKCRNCSKIFDLNEKTMLRVPRKETQAFRRELRKANKEKKREEKMVRKEQKKMGVKPEKHAPSQMMNCYFCGHSFALIDKAHIPCPQCNCINENPLRKDAPVMEIVTGIAFFTVLLVIGLFLINSSAKKNHSNSKKESFHEKQKYFHEKKRSCKVF